MRFQLKQIATAIDAELVGEGNIWVAAVAEPAQAQSADLALAFKPEFAAQLGKGHAVAAVMWAGADWQSYGLRAALLLPRPRYAMAQLSKMMDDDRGVAKGVHPSAVIEQDAQLGQDVAIGPFVVIEQGAVIGDHCSIAAHCMVGAQARLGKNARLHSHVSIGARCVIGDDFIAQPGVRIGGDGFSFVTPEASAVERVRETLGAQGEAEAQSWSRIHSLGAVWIGDDVEIGANSCVDRGTIRDTRIGHGVKIDNLAQIGHNVDIGDHTMVCAQVGIAGSSKIGQHVVLGGQTGVSDNITIGDSVITGGATKVLSNVHSGRVMLGYPAMAMDKHIEIYKHLRRLPRQMNVLREIQKLVFNSKKLD